MTPVTEIAVERGAVSGLAISADGALMMVTHYGDDSFSVIDANSGAVVQTVVDVDEPFAIAISDTSGRAYISSASAAYDSVLAFDIAANRVLETYPLAYSISDLTVSPNGRCVYAGRTGADGADVAILDTASGAEHALSIAGTGTVTERLLLSPDGRRLYIAVNGVSAAELVVVDTRRNRVLSRVEIGSAIRDIALSPDGATAYVGSCGPDFGTVLDVIDVRDAQKCAITDTLKIGDAAGMLSGLAVSRDGSRVYLVGDAGVTVLATATHDVVGSIETGAQPSCAVESPAGNRLYIADYAGTVAVLAVDAAGTPATAPASDDAPTTPHPWAAFADLLALEPTPA
ncbi:YncE family protein [Mycobacterium cookii]|uniref:YncE family protein n=1 Tax=Mycobacterium cookii TaxID=1775 RepID=UPI0013D39F3C|nr:YncE family protein [Mycobacterium cookii]MCV7331826.1 YncE family protein [Mycobacterium cookii]